MKAFASSFGRDSAFRQKQMAVDPQLEDYSMPGGFDLGRVGLEFSLDEGVSMRLSLVAPTLQASVETASLAVLGVGAGGDALVALALGEVPGLVHVAESFGWGGDGRAFAASDFSAVGTSVAALAKLQHGLADIYVEAQLQVAELPGVGREAALADFVSSNKVARTANGFVAIDAVAADGDGAALLAELEKLGLERGASFGRLAGGLMPIDALDELAALDLLAFARPVYATSEVGLVTSQNIVSMNGDYVQALGFDGSGVTIGILSDSFATRVSPLTTYAQDISNGDLPSAGVNILADYTATGTIDEGRGMAQLIHDMAPGASLAFHTAFVSAADFAQGILDLVNAGADIIVDDIRYFAEPFFQDGIIAQAVDQAVGMGALYFASAGNYGLRSYASAEWRPSGQFVSSGGRIYELYDFNPGTGVDTIQSITKTGSGATTYIFNWDQPNFSVSGGTGAQTEMQLFLHNGTSYATAASNNIGGDAIDLLQSSSTGFTGIAIGLQVGHAEPGRFQYVTIGGGFSINEYQTNSGSSFGHSNAAGALSVGASDWVDSGRFGNFPISGESFPYLEDFSSRGDIPILFDTAGNRLASPEYRSTVDFTAGDGGNTSFFGSDASYDADTHPNFYGTSAAAPNAAAVAALLKQAFPTATNAQIIEAMRATALDVQVTYLNTQIGDGADNRSGAGLIQADQAYNYLSELLTPDSTLTAGQVAIIQFNTEDSDDPHVAGTQNMARDSLSFVLLDGVTVGTQIHFTDRTWTHSGTVLNGGTFSNSGADGTYTWTAATDLAAGTVITINEAELTAAGMELIDTGEAVYVYQGAANTPVRFLGAIEMADGNDIFNASLTNTGLTAGVNAFGIAEDNGSFGERSWNHQPSTLLQNIVEHANWHTNENSPQANHVEGTNLFVAPDHQLWMAGISGGHGLMSVTHDSTQNGGASYNQQYYLQNTDTDGNGLTSTQRFWSPTHILFDTVGNRFFVVDSDGGVDRILQGSINDLVTNPGGVPEMMILWSDKSAGPDGDGVTGMQLDIANGHVYFTADNKLLRIGFNDVDQVAVTLVDFGFDEDSFAKNFANEFVLDLANKRAFIIQTEIVSDIIEIPPGSGKFIAGMTTHQNSIHLVSNLSSTDTGVGDNSHVQLNFTEAFDDDDNAFGDQLNEFDNLKGRITDIEINKSTGEIWFTTVQLNGGTDGSVGGIYKATLSGNTLNVVQIYTEGNGTNQNFLHIHIDEETGHYYVSSQEPGEGGRHAIYRGNLSDAAGTAPTFYADVGNINDMTPRDLTLESAPTLTGTDAAGGVTEASSAPNSGATAKVTLFSGVTAGDIDTSGGDELAGAIVRISDNFLRETSTTAGHSVSQDFLTINNLTSGTIAGSGITFAYDNTTGVMTLSGPGTVAEYQAALELVQFHTSGDNPTNDGTNLVRTISASVFDGLLYSDEISATVSVTGINNAPVNTMGLNDSGSEDLAIAITGLAVADADASPSEEDITVTLNVTNGTLTIGSVGGGIMLADVTGNGTSTVTITATQNEINTTFAGAGGVTFNPAAHYNGAATLTMTTSDLGQNGNDPGTSGTGTTEQDVDVKSILISEVNDAPTVGGDGTESAAVIFEDAASSTGQTVASLFGGQFSDALDQQFVSGTNPGGSVGDTFVGIAITANGSAAATGQWQYFNGSVWTDIGAASADAAITLNSATAIRFNPALNFNGAAPTLTARLIESGGAAIVDGGTVDLNPAPPTVGAGSVYSAASVVLSQTVTAVNDAPTSAGLSGDAASWTEHDGTTLLDVGSNSTFADIDSADFDGGTLTVALSGAAKDVNQDQLVIDTSGSVSVAGNAVLVSGIQIATFTGGGAGGGALVFTFDADANSTSVQTLVRAIGFTSSGGDDPSEGTRTVTWTLVDGDGTANGGADTLVVTSSVSVLASNDAPAGADKTVSLSEDGSYTFGSADFGFSDVDGNAFAGVVLTTLPSAGDLYLNGVAITAAGTFISAADIGNALLTFEPDADGNGANYATFTFQVRDDGAAQNSAGGENTDQTPNTISIDVTAVNDAPTSTGLSGDAASWTEHDGTTLLDVGSNSTFADIDSADFDGGTLTVALSGAAKDVNQDQLVIDTSGTVSVAGNAVLVSGIQIATFTGGGAGGGALVFTFDSDASSTSVQTLVRAIGFTSSGGDDPSEGTRTVTWTLVDGDGTANGGADTLVVTSSVSVLASNDAPSGADKTITASEDDPYSFTANDFGFSDTLDGNGFAGVVLTTLPAAGDLYLNGVAITAAGTFVSAADIAGGLLTFLADADQFGDAYTTFTFQVRDDGAAQNSAGGENTDQTPNTITLDVTPDNVAPVLDLNGAAAGSDSSASVSEQSGPATLAPDLVVTDGNDTNLEGATVQISAGLQAADLLSVGGVPNGTSGTISWTYTAATGVLAFTGSASLADYQAILRQVAIETNGDAVGTSRTVTWTVTDGDVASNSPTTAVTVTEINDPPAITLGDNDVQGTEDTDLVFTGASTITIFDPDFETLTVTLTVANGRLTLAQTSGLAFSTGDGTGDATMTFSGSASDITAALDGLVYRGNLNFEGSDTLQILVDDGDDTDSDSIAITLADDGVLHGDSGNNVINGTPQRDVFHLQQGGNDIVNGLAGNDSFYFGGAYNSADEVNAGDGNDSIILQGDYSAGITVGTITGLESISLAPGDFTSFGDTANNFYDYDLTTTDANVGAGSFLKVNGFLLRAGEDFTFDGSAETDGTFTLFAGKGVDTLVGGAKNDFFLFGQDGRFAAGDTVVGGAGYDSFYLRGNYTLDFNAPALANSFSGIESVTLASAMDSQFFSGGGSEFDYSITWNDAMLASGQTITINGSRLLSAESMTFIGSSELGGHFRIFAGAGDDDLRGGTGNDLILGGRGADTMYGGGGNDVFRYDSVLDSNSIGRDGIQDFSLGDKIDLDRIDAKSGTAANDAFTFIGSGAFTGTGASSAGQLRCENAGGPIWLVQGDVDGDGVSDLEFFVLVTDADPITATDFVL